MMLVTINSLSTENSHRYFRSRIRAVEKEHMFELECQNDEFMILQRKNMGKYQIKSASFFFIKVF